MTNAALSGQIASFLAERGPQTGEELLEAFPSSTAWEVWRACHGNAAIVVRSVARRYLRLDRHLEGGVRLSPSISREFFTYSVAALGEQSDELERRARQLDEAVQAISRAKLRLAQSIVSDVLLRTRQHIEGLEVLALLAGDVAYSMAHTVERIESSSGRAVRGSDIDMVFVVEGDGAEKAIAAIDEALLALKWRYLTLAVYREEIDFIVKTLARADQQLASDDFSSLVAAKVMLESVQIGGSETLGLKLRDLMNTHGTRQRIESLAATAAREREQVEARLTSEHAPPQGNDRAIFEPVEDSIRLP